MQGIGDENCIPCPAKGMKECCREEKRGKEEEKCQPYPVKGMWKFVTKENGVGDKQVAFNTPQKA